MVGRERDLSLDEAAEALDHIDPHDRDTWLRMGMALKAEYGDDAFSTWDAWSATAGNYQESAARTAWKGFRNHGRVTLGTLIHAARQAGWQPPQRERSEAERSESQKARETRQRERREEAAREAEQDRQWQQRVARLAGECWAELGTVGRSPYLGEKRVGGHGVGFAKRGLLLVIDEAADRAELITGRDAIRAFFADRPQDREGLSIRYLKPGTLAVPMCDSHGTLWGLQFIFQGGAKKFLRRGRKRGTFHLIGETPVEGSPWAIAEGYATAATIHEATGWPVVVTWDAANLVTVTAELARQGWPMADAVIAGDDDHESTDAAGNPLNKGRECACRAAGESGGITAFPRFAEPAGRTDWNDLQHEQGQAAVREQLHAAIERGGDGADAPPGADEGPPDMGEEEPPPPDPDAAPADLATDQLALAVNRLAAMRPLEYDKVREAEAKELGVRVGTLDKEVAARRKATAKAASTPRPASHQEAWEALLVRNDKHQVMAQPHNLITILEHHADWRGVFALDAFANEIRKLADPPYAAPVGPLSDVEGTEVAAWFGHPDTYRMSLKSSTALEAVEAVAARHAFHPVREYLGGLKWDGIERLDHLLSDYFGAQHDEYTAAVGRNWLMSAVKRILEPGCKVDFMVILEGEQGRGKSTAVRTLCGPDWFAELLASPGDKDFYQVLTGRWIVEIPELQSFNKSDRNKIKAAISAQEDTYRPSYGRYARQFPRQNIFVGTTNDHAYLKDETGARRFLPVTVGWVEIEGLRVMRNQLWAEAVERVRRGETWWEFPASAKDEQDKRYDADVWHQPIVEWLDGEAEDGAYPNDRFPRMVTPERPVERTTVHDVMRYALGVETAKQSKQDQMRAAGVLRAIGWRPRQVREGSRRVRYYERPPEEGEDDARDECA